MVRISNFQVMVMVFSSILANGIMYLPRVAAGIGGPGGWIVVLLHGIVTLIALVVLAMVCRRFPNDSFVNLSKKVFGSFIGTIVGVIIVIYFIMVAGGVARGVSNIAITAVYSQTPIIVLIGALIAVAAYAIHQGIEVLARANTLLFVLKFLAMVGILFLIIPVINVNNLLPLWDRGPVPWAEGIVNIHGAFSGIIILAFLYPNIDKHKDTVKMASFGLLIAIISYVMVTILAIGTFGCNEVARMLWPTILLIRRVTVPVDAPFMMAWVAGAFSVIAACLYIASDALKDILKLKDYRTILLPLAIIAMVIGVLPRNMAEYGQFSMNLGSIGFILEILLPFIMLVLITITGRKEPKE